jgi:hypothetical protein
MIVFAEFLIGASAVLSLFAVLAWFSDGGKW